MVPGTPVFTTETQRHRGGRRKALRGYSLILRFAQNWALGRCQGTSSNPVAPGQNKDNSFMQAEVQNIVELIKERAGQFEAARLKTAQPKMNRGFNFQLNVGEFGIFVTNVQSSVPARMDVGVGWNVDPRTRDWDESDRHQEVHGFALVNGAWTDIETGDRWSEATIVDWAVATLQVWIEPNGKV